jgi:hypothetical protein
MLLELPCKPGWNNNYICLTIRASAEFFQAALNLSQENISNIQITD